MSSKQTSGRALSRRKILRYGLYGGLAASLPGSGWLGGCGKRRRGKRPNIILIVLDTLRADHLGCYGYNRPTSPTLDKLASEGVLFEDASAPSPWTLPSHGSLLTGFYPSRLSLNGELRPLPSDVETLATVLLQHDLGTAAFVNSFYLSRKFGFDKGFEEFLFLPENHSPPGAAPEIVKLAIKWLQKHRNEQFYLFLHFFDVHSGYRSMPWYERQFTGSYYGSVDGSTAQLLAFREGKFSLNKNDIKHLVALYDAGIRQLDDQLQKLFDFLQQRGLLENSFLIVTSDHGEEFLDHGGVLHGRTQYQELIKVPLIIRGPDIPQAQRIKDMVSLVDIMPTVLSVLDIPSATAFEGCSISPLWQKGGAKLPDRFIFAEADHNNVKDNIKRAVRHPQYKLHYDLLSEKYELYDLANDPKESVNITSEQTAMTSLLSEELKKFMRNYKAGERPVLLSPEDIKKLKSLGYL